MTQDKISAPKPIKPPIDPLERCNSSFEMSSTANIEEPTNGRAGNGNSKASAFSDQFKSFTPNATKLKARSFHFPRRPSYTTLETERESFYNLDYPDNVERLSKEQLDPRSRFYARRRERTLNLPQMLPYQTESPRDQAKFLSHIISHLYIAIKTLDIQGSLSVTAKDLASVKANLSDIDVALETNLFEIGENTNPSQTLDDESSNYFSMEELNDTDDDEDMGDDDDDDEEDEEIDGDEYEDDITGHESAVQHKKSPKSAAIVGVRIWTHELLVWLKMKYDMPIKLRTSLARVYYAICLSRGQHINLKTYVKTFEILTKDNVFMKQQGLRLSWEPLCNEILNHFPTVDASNGEQQYEKKDQKELLRLAEKASFFFDKAALPDIYSKIGSRFSIPNASLVFSSFYLLPLSFTEGSKQDPEDIRHYIESFFYMWSKLSKSSGIDVHLTTRLGNIAIAALTEKANNPQSDHVKLCEFGVFSTNQMNFIFNTLKNSLSIMNDKYASLKSTFFHGFSSSIIFSITGDSSSPTTDSDILNKLSILINSIESYVHPSNSGEWSRPISKLVLSLVYQFHKRYNMETQESGLLYNLPSDIKLSTNAKLIDKFVLTFLPIIKIGIQSKYPKAADDYQRAMHMLAFIRPEFVLETMLLDIYESLEGVISTHRVTVALRTLEELSRYFASTPIYRTHVTRILSLVLPGIDSNDLEKSLLALNVFAALANFIPFHDLTGGEGDTTLAIQFTSEHLEYLQTKLVSQDVVPFAVDPELELMALKSSSTAFKTIFKRLFERIFILLENLPDPAKSTGMEKLVSEGLPKYIYDVFESLSDDIFRMISEEMFSFISENTYHTIADVVAEICGGIVKRDSKRYFKKFAVHLMDRIREDIEENGAGVSRTGVDIVSRDQPLFWNIVILNECIGNATTSVVDMGEELQNFSFFLMDHVKGPAVFASSYMLNQLLQATTKIRLNENRLISPHYEKKHGIDEKCWGGFQFDEERFKKENLDFSWFIPTNRELKFAVDVFNVHVSKSLKNISTIMKRLSDKKTTEMNADDMVNLSDELRMNFLYLGYGTSGMSFLFDPSFDEDIPKLHQHTTQTIQQRLVLLNQIRQMKGSKSHGKDELRIESIHENLQKIVEDLNSNDLEYELEKEVGSEGERYGKRTGENDEDHENHKSKDDDGNIKLHDEDSLHHGAVPSHFNLAEHLSHVASSDSIASMDASARQSPGIDGVDISTMNPGITFRDQKLYTSNYLFGDDIDSRRSNELYVKLHKIRHLIGKSLHIIYKLLITHFHDNTNLFKHYLYVLGIWFTDVGRERLLDYSHAKISFGYTSALQQINKVRKPFTRIAISARLEAYHSFRVLLHATSRTQTDLDKILLEDVVRLCFSTYSAVSKPAQAALVDAMKRLNGSYNVLIRSSLRYLSKAIEEKNIQKIESGLHTFCLKRIKHKVQNDYFNIQKYVELLQKCLLVDESDVNLLAQKLLKGVYNNLTPPSSVCIIHDMEEINCIRPPDEFIDLEINVVKLAKENKRKLYLDKLKKFERMVLSHENLNSHWKTTSLNLHLLINLQSEMEIPVNKEVLSLLSEAASNEHPLIARLAIKGASTIIKKIVFLESIEFDCKNAYDFNYVPKNYKNIDTSPLESGNGKVVSYYETWKKEIQNSAHPDYFIDNKASTGWLFWDTSMMVVNSQAGNLADNFSENTKQALDTFGSRASKRWFLDIVNLWIADNESTFAFQGSDVLFTSTLVYLISTNFAKNITFDDILSIIEEVYVADEKASHIIVCELVAGLLISSKSVYFDKKLLQTRDDFLVGFLGKIFEHDLNPDNSGVWNIFSWWVSSSVDVRRFPKVVEKCFTTFQIDKDSDSAFYISTRLNYIKSYIAAISWSYPIPDETTLMCLDNIGHRYQSIRDQIGSLLAILTFVYYTESLPSMSYFLENCNKNEGSQLLENNKNNKIHELIPVIFEKIEVERLAVVNLSPQEILQSPYIYSVSTMLTWLDQALITSVAIVYQDYVDSFIVPFLLKLTNMKDVCQLGNLDPITVFKRISQIPFSIETLEKIVVMVESYSRSDTLNVVQSFIMGEFTETFYFKNLYKLSRDQRHRIIALTNNLIYHKNVEVREAASSTLSGLMHISPPEEVDAIVQTFKLKYSKDLDKTRKKYQKAKNNYKNMTANDTITLHGATLGLGALIHAFPYLSPPPKWVPELLTILANKCSGLPGLVGKTAKESLGKFKKNRQDSWHIDSKVFNEEQMQDLEGVLWKSYFI